MYKCVICGKEFLDIEKEGGYYVYYGCWICGEKNK